MLLQKVRMFTDEIAITPVLEKDNAIFKHCTDGHTHCLSRYFNKDVKPVLLAHGVETIIVRSLRKGK